jgi:hypothetical protein
MKSSKTSDPKPSSVHLDLIRPRQIQAPQRRIQVIGARNKQAVWTSVRSTLLWEATAPGAKVGTPAAAIDDVTVVVATAPDAVTVVVTVAPAPMEVVTVVVTVCPPPMVAVDTVVAVIVEVTEFVAEVDTEDELTVVVEVTAEDAVVVAELAVDDGPVIVWLVLEVL